MSENGHVAERTCGACRKKKQKSELLAVKRLSAGDIVLDVDNNIAGRGAYLCRNRACINRARNRKGTDLISLSLKKTVPDSIWEEILKLFP